MHFQSNFEHRKRFDNRSARAISRQISSPPATKHSFPASFIPVFDPVIQNAPTLAVVPQYLQVHAFANSLYSFDNINITTNNDVSESSWQVVDNPAFAVLLDGHFYLDDVNTIDAEVNLQKFLHKISVSTLAKGLKSIAGGLFNLVIVDKERQKLLVTGDKYGVMPLYYWESESGFFLSGNPFAFRKVAKLSEESVVEFLKYGYLPFAKSLFQNVERRMPGQTLTVDLESQRLGKTPPAIFEFKPPVYREKELPAAGEKVHDALSKYFSRFDDADYHIGLRDDYASQLLTTWLQRFRPNLWNRGASKSALKLARHYNLPVRPAPVNWDLLPRFSDDIARHTRLAISLEHTDVFDWQHRAAHSPDSFFMDELSGDCIMGGQSFLDLPNDVRGMISHIRGEDKFNTPIKSINHYQRLLYNDVHALPDEELGGILTLGYECWFLNAARGILEINRLAGHTHEDFRESLHNFTMARSLSIAKAIGVQQHTACSSPFLDYEVLQSCLDTDKSLRASDRLYNYYWNTYFPEAAILPNELWGRNPLDAPQIYRFKEAARMITRQNLVGGKNMATGKTAVNPDAEARKLLQHPAVKRWAADAIDRHDRRIPDFIANQIRRKNTEKQLNPRLMLRYITLLSFLND